MNQRVPSLGLCRHWLGGLALAVLLAGCGKTQVPHGELSPTPPNSGPPDYNFDATFADVMEFEQGIPYKYILLTAAHVPAPGQPLLTIDNLPATATFDGETLSWTPPCDGDPQFYARGFGVQYVIVTLRSSADQAQFIERRAALFVHQYQVYPDRKCGTQ